MVQRTRWTVAALTVAAVLVATPAWAQDAAPATTVSPDGRTATAGPMTLAASQAAGLAPGQAVTVSGRGFDANKGIYVALCVVPPTDMAPTPCGGGQDRTGAGDGSAWISSNPPSYAAGLTQPYGPDGSFTVTLTISPQLPDGLDCYSVRCAIFTRADHTRSSDRSLDVGIPVTFATEAPAPPTTAAPTTVAPTTTVVQTTTSTTAATTSTTAAVDVDDPDDERALDVAGAPASSDDGGTGAPPLVAAVALLVVAGALGTRHARRTTAR